MDGFRALCGRDDVDVIVILSPEWYGPLPILAACDSGKSVYCGAALDIEPAASAAMLKQRVEEAGIAFMAEFPRRQAPATLRLKELIATRLGKPRLLFCHRALAGRTATARRAGRRQSLPDDAARDDRAGRLVPLCRRERADFRRRHRALLHGSSRRRRLPDDEPRFFARRASSAPAPSAQISCGRYMPASWPEAVAFRPPAALQVCCEHGIAFIDLPATLIWFDEAGRHMESLDSERPVGEQLLMQFYRAVTSLVRKTSDLEDAYRALSIVLAARQSFERASAFTLRRTCRSWIRSRSIVLSDGRIIRRYSHANIFGLPSSGATMTGGCSLRSGAAPG